MGQPTTRHRFLAQPRRLFYFYIFRKHFLQKYIFNITIYSFVPLPPGRGPAAQQLGGRDLYVNLKKNYLRGSPWREPAARQGGGRLPQQIAISIRCVLDMDTNKNH